MEKLNRSKKHAFTLSCVAIAVCILSFPCRSEIQFDGSVGVGGVYDAERSGNYHIIRDSDGQIVGSNLFYSFSYFNLPAGESVIFNNSQSSLDNVISRVTGGQPSQLNGGFYSFIPNANFWFINPAGIVFGDQASLNINGSFYVSTADYLKFADGQRWETTTATTPVLSSATPESFGFLNGHPPAGISFYGTGSGLAENYLGIKFSVQEGKTLAIVGGDTTITGGKLLGMVDVESRIKAPSGRVAIASVASAGEVDLSKEDLGTESFSKLGKIKMDAGSYVDTSGEGGGEIIIRGGELTLNNAFLVSDTKGRTDGKRIDIDVWGNIDFSTNSAGIYARTLGDGKGADVNVAADTLTLADSALITVGAKSNGKGGDISVNVNTLNVTSASIKTEKGDGSTGEGGQLAIQADTINLNEKALVASHAGNYSKNKGGDILITANNDMTLSGGAAVSSGTGLFGNAKGGDVTVDVKGQLTIKDAVATSPSGIYSNAGDGDAGKLTVKAKNLTLENGAAIGGDNFSAGRGADIDIHVEENLSLQSDASNPDSSAWISAKSSLALAQSGIFPTGAPGNINISANTLSFYGPRSGITTFSFSNNNDAGDVTLKAKSLELGDHARIEGSTGGYYGKGKAADFLFQVEQLTLSDGAVINSSSATEGAAGDIRVENAKTLDIQGDSTDAVSGIFSTSFWKGDAGKISISATDINLRGYSEISTITSGVGRGGDIELKDAEDIVLSGRGGILSRTYGFFGGNAAAGNVSVATGQLTLKDGFTIDTNTQGDGNAGTIDIAAVNSIVIDEASRVSTSTANEGVAGKVGLAAGESITIANSSFVGSSSFYRSHSTVEQIGDKGAAGNVALTAKQVLINEAGAVFAETADSKGGSVDIHAGQLSLDQGGQISTSTYGQGQAGNVVIRGQNDQTNQQVSINGVRDDFPGQLPDGRKTTGQASGIYLNTAGTGNGGNLDLQTQHLKISDGGLISAVAAFGSSAETQGGDITIQADSIDLQSGGLISAATSGIGKAGNVNVTATDSLSISGTFNRTQHANFTNPRITDHSGINNSASFSLDNRAQHLGSSGSIRVNAGNLSLTDGGEISVANEGTDAGSVGGSISIDAGKRFYSHNGRISAATASAEGGDITLKAQDMIHLVDSQISTSVAGGKGSGGNINIDPQFLILDNSQITAQALQGAGGNIKIIAEHFIATPDSILSASSQFGVDGKVIIDSPDTNMLGKMATLTTKFLDPATLFKEQCEARYNAGLSSLSVMVTDVKAAPGESYLTDTPESTTSNSPRSCQKPIQQNSW